LPEGHAKREAAPVFESPGAQEIQHIEVVVQVHGMGFGGSRRYIKNKHSIGSEERGKKRKFSRQIGQVLQHIEGKNRVEAVLLCCCFQIVFGSGKVHRQSMLLRTGARKSHGHALHIKVSNRMPTARQFQKDLAVPRAVIQTRSAGKADDLQVGLDSLVLEVVSRNSKEIKFGVLPVT